MLVSIILHITACAIATELLTKKEIPTSRKGETIMGKTSRQQKAKKKKKKKKVKRIGRGSKR